MAVMNTEFIRLCVQADSRIRTVMVAIRYWASIYGLSGGGRGGRTWKITNYALTMLIIFYLQVMKCLNDLTLCCTSLEIPRRLGFISLVIDGASVLN